jgi:hypothetical protein
MKISMHFNHPTTREACRIVMMHYQDKDFLDLISQAEFNHTMHDSFTVANRLRNLMFGLEIDVKLYKTLNPWSKVIGYADGETIYVNERKLDLPLLDRIENIYHEATHLCGFSHLGNTPNKYNLETVPYKAANIFAKYCKGIYDQ